MTVCSYFSKVQFYNERVIALSYVDINDTAVEADDAALDLRVDKNKDRNIRKRLFVLTTHGI